tara:strand:- start:4560 stop:4868 length:309 start_codon:yes stop_codon:yes gene_type:complete
MENQLNINEGMKIMYCRGASGFSLPGCTSQISGATYPQQEDNSKNKTPRKRMVFDVHVYTKQWVIKNYSYLILYFCLVVGVVFSYHLISDGDFSFLLVCCVY